MINNGSLELNQFLTMHPFSVTQKDVYNAALGDIDYFKELYVRDISLYGYMAKLCSILRNSEKKLAVITGYRGCGKTNFLHFIKYISEDGEVGPTLREQYEESLNLLGGNNELREVMEKSFDKVIEQIHRYVNGELSDDAIEQNGLLEWFKINLAGNYRYINFDIGSMGRGKGEAPFVNQLYFELHDSIEWALKKNVYLKSISILKEFVNKYGWEIRTNFESQQTSKESLHEFWQDVEPIIDNYQERNFINNLFEKLYKLSLSQILLAFILWDYSVAIAIDNSSSDAKKQVYMFDNIDIISGMEGDVFESKTAGFWSFIWNSRVFFNNISVRILGNRKLGIEEDSELVEKIINLYSNTKFIFAMRETTAMYLTDHLRDRFRGLLGHFDMSTTFDKVVCMQKKLEFAGKLVAQNKIDNALFVDYVCGLNNLLNDKLFMYDLVQLYNNDYRTFATAVSSVCARNMNSIKAANALFKTNDIRAFGSRCIVNRCFFNGFAAWRYYDSLGIFAPAMARPMNTNPLWKKYKYTTERTILTVLLNVQGNSANKFFLETDDSVSLKTLYNYLDGIIERNDFVGAIDSMYALRNEKFWAHLITFDNLAAYSETKIAKYLQKNTDDLSNVYVRVTPAGIRFIKMMCVHYEYFACRFSRVKRSLFEILDVEEETSRRDAVCIMKDVYESVKECCKNLKEFNAKILEITGYHSYRQISGTPYYINNQFHEERIIHQHISYLEAYRRCVRMYTKDEKCVRTLEKEIISYISKYLGLLKHDLNEGLREDGTVFYSDNSKVLFKELNRCIKEISEHPEKSADVEITREYYRKHFDNEEYM